MPIKAFGIQKCATLIRANDISLNPIFMAFLLDRPKRERDGGEKRQNITNNTESECIGQEKPAAILRLSFWHNCCSSL